VEIKIAKFLVQEKKLTRNEVVPDKFAIPTKTFARSDGTPAFLNTVEEK
jgi:hypothetical protein